MRGIGILAGGNRAGHGVICHPDSIETVLGRQENSYVSTSPTDTSLAAVPADQFDPASGGIGAYDTPLGITNPPIDELLERVSSKYALVIYAAKRARQINDYYNQLGEGILEYVGPLVEPGLQEKPLSIAMREIHADLLEHTEGE
jgi:DNA-directed RNA polymerase subunit omega